MNYTRPVLSVLTAMINPNGYPNRISSDGSDDNNESNINEINDVNNIFDNENKTVRKLERFPDSKHVINIYSTDPLDHRVHRAWLNMSPDVARKQNPFPSSTKQFGLFCLIVSSIVAISKLCMGLSFIDECPTNDFIPMYQYVGGILELLFLITLRFRKLWFVTIFQIPLGIIMFIWFLISSCYTFVEFQPDYFKSGRRYCEFYFYRFCLIVQMSQFVLYLLLLFYVCIKFGFYD